MINNNSSVNNLIELKNYLINKYNIQVYLNTPKEINIIKKIEEVYIKLFF
jgi:hypothetical protein